jgi:hypothetical protein
MTIADHPSKEQDYSGGHFEWLQTAARDPILLFSCGTFSSIKLRLENHAQLFSFFSDTESKAISKSCELCKIFFDTLWLGIILRIYLVSSRIIQ